MKSIFYLLGMGFLVAIYFIAKSTPLEAGVNFGVGVSLVGCVVVAVYELWKGARKEAEEIATYLRRHIFPPNNVRVRGFSIRINRCVITPNDEGPVIHVRPGHPPIEITECHIHGSPSSPFPILLLEGENHTRIETNPEPDTSASVSESESESEPTGAVKEVIQLPDRLYEDL